MLSLNTKITNDITIANKGKDDHIRNVINLLYLYFTVFPPCHISPVAESQAQFPKAVHPIATSPPIIGCPVAAMLAPKYRPE